jgi:hypothetical protein
LTKSITARLLGPLTQDASGSRPITAPVTVDTPTIVSDFGAAQLHAATTMARTARLRSRCGGTVGLRST